MFFLLRMTCPECFSLRLRLFLQRVHFWSEWCTQQWKWEFLDCVSCSSSNQTGVTLAKPSYRKWQFLGVSTFCERFFRHVSLAPFTEPVEHCWGARSHYCRSWVPTWSSGHETLISCFHRIYSCWPFEETNGTHLKLNRQFIQRIYIKCQVSKW